MHDEGGTMTDRPNHARAWSIVVLVAGGIGFAIPVRAADEIDRVLAESGKTRYEHYCTSCHGPGGAPGEKAKSDLRSYVSRHGGKFPASDWIAIVAETRPSAIHTAVWEQMRKDQVGTNADVAARGMVAEIARYVVSIQTKSK